MNDEARQWLRREGFGDDEIADLTEDEIQFLWMAVQQMEEMTPDELTQALENTFARIYGISMTAEAICTAVNDAFVLEGIEEASKEDGG
jgi:hypothetical protein